MTLRKAQRPVLHPPQRLRQALVHGTGVEQVRREEVPVIHVQHRSSDPGSPLHPEQPGVEFKPEARPLPGERIVTKQVNSAFIGTDLHAYLQDRGIRTLVVGGLTSDHYVSSPARMAGNFGYRVYVVRDATATFDRRSPDGGHFSTELMHETALVSLYGEFARMVTTDDVLGGVRGCSMTKDARARPK